VLARPDGERGREPLRAAENRSPLGSRVGTQFIPAQRRLGLQQFIVSLRRGQLVAAKPHQVARRTIDAARPVKQTFSWACPSFGLRLITIGAFDVLRRLIWTLLRARIADAGRLKPERLKNLLAQHVVELMAGFASRDGCHKSITGVGIVPL